MGVIGDMNQFQQYQMGQAMLEAAQNPAGGGMGEGMGMGMGWAMANRMAQSPGRVPGAAAPPPPPVAAWHIAQNGQSQGPFTPQQLAQSVAGGTLSPTTLVWSAGLQTWTPAGQVPQLAGLFQAPAAPPPLPPG